MSEEQKPEGRNVSLSAGLESGGNVSLTEYGAVGGRCVCLTFDDKYEVCHTENGPLTAWRNGDPWLDLTGDKLFLTMHSAIADLMKQLSNAQLKPRTRRRRGRRLEALVGHEPPPLQTCAADCLVALAR